MIWNAVRSGLGSPRTSQRPLGDRPLGVLPYSATGAQRPVSCMARVVWPVRASITRTAVLPALSISMANAVLQPGAPITCPRSMTTRPLASMTVVLSAPPRTKMSLARVVAGEVDPIGLRSWPAEPQAAATIAGRTAAERRRRIAIRTTTAAGGSLTRPRGAHAGLGRGRPHREARDPACLSRGRNALAREGERGRGRSGRRRLWHAVDLHAREIQKVAQGVGDTRSQQQRRDKNHGEGCGHRRKRPALDRQARPPRTRAALGDPRQHRGP